MENSKDLKIKSVESFWNDHPCGSDNSFNENKYNYFQEIELHRYSKIKSILEMGDFDKYKGMKVLEIGCGVGTDGKQFAKNGTLYTGINLDENSANLAHDNFTEFKLEGKIYQMNAESLEFEDETFDHIYSHGVIHHSPNTGEIVKEMFRVLKPGGTVNVMIYNKSSINYYIEIMFLRKIFKVLLYPKFAPHILAKIIGLKKEVLFRHREIMLNENMTNERWISINTDGPDCPLAKVYDQHEATILFEQVGFKDIKNYLRYFNKEHYGHLGNLLPEWFVDYLGKKAGWHRWIKCVKPN